MKTACLAIFAKAPVAGEVKTRLLPHLIPEQAAELHRAFVLDTLTRLQSLQGVQQFVACHPSSSEPFFKQIAQDYKIGLIDQVGNDLGERMSHAVKTLMTDNHQKVVLIGTDSPTLPLFYLESAFESLEHQPVVLGPSQDGGYYLIGLTRWIPELFEGVSWSTDRVFKLTLDKVRRLGLQCLVLPEWFDVDDLSGLRALSDQLNPNPDLAPHTWKFLQSHPVP